MPRGSCGAAVGWMLTASKTSVGASSVFALQEDTPFVTKVPSGDVLHSLEVNGALRDDSRLADLAHFVT